MLLPSSYEDAGYQTSDMRKVRPPDASGYAGFLTTMADDVLAQWQAGGCASADCARRQGRGNRQAMGREALYVFY